MRKITKTVNRRVRPHSSWFKQFANDTVPSTAEAKHPNRYSKTKVKTALNIGLLTQHSSENKKLSSK